MKIGALISISKSRNIDDQFRALHELDLDCCQTLFWDTSMYTQEVADQLKAASAKYGVEITAVWAGWAGPMEWDFKSGPVTLGLVPAAYRDSRLKELFRASDFLQMVGVTDMITHVGFLPENPNDPDFVGVVAALRSLCKHLKNRGQYFLFETGQETPTTMLRAIEHIGTGNVGINFDTANLICYGKANSADALEVFGKYVRNTHCKDGLYPTCGDYLGEEVPLGEGKANLPAVFGKLKELGYTGPYVIEREITGEQQIADIKMGRDLIRSVLKELDIE